MKTRISLIIFSLIGILLISACNLVAPATQDSASATETFAVLEAIAYQTAVAQLTQSAEQNPGSLPTLVPTELPTQVPTQVPVVVTNTPVPPTPTATTVPATATATQVPTKTPVPATATATATPTLTTYQCSVVSSSPVSGTTMVYRYDFDGRWTFKNTGTEKWELGSVDFVYISGTKFQKYHDVVDISKTVAKGETVEFIVDMLSPDKPGTYTATWGLRRGTLIFCKVDLQIIVK